MEISDLFRKYVETPTSLSTTTAATTTAAVNYGKDTILMIRKGKVVGKTTL